MKGVSSNSYIPFFSSHGSKIHRETGIVQEIYTYYRPHSQRIGDENLSVVTVHLCKLEEDLQVERT